MHGINTSKYLVQVCDVANVRIAPEVFQCIVFPDVFLEHVRHNIGIVQQDPFPIGLAFLVPGVDFQVLLHFCLYAVRDGIYLGVAAAAANDHVVGKGIFDVAQVQHGYFLCFLVLHAFDDVLGDGFYGNGGCRGGGVFCHAGRGADEVVVMVGAKWGV